MFVMRKTRLATSEKDPLLKPYKTDTETSRLTKQGSPEHQKECGCNWTDGAATNGASVGCRVIICSHTSITDLSIFPNCLFHD